MAKNQQLKAKALAQLLFEEAEEQDSLLNKYLEKLTIKFTLENPGEIDQEKLQKHLFSKLERLNERVVEND